MFKSNDKKIVISICCLLVILLIVGIVFWVKKTNNKPVKHNTSKEDNKEHFADDKSISLDDFIKTFRSNPEDIEEIELNDNNLIKSPVNNILSDDLIKTFTSNPEDIEEIVPLDNLLETITNIFNSKMENKVSDIYDMINEYMNIDFIDKLPIGTIIMWNKEELPNDKKWAWCDGKEGRPNLKYRFPLGGKDYGGEENKPPETENNGILSKYHIPKHKHKLNGTGPNGTFPSFKHTHHVDVEYDGTHTHGILGSNWSGGSLQSNSLEKGSKSGSNTINTTEDSDKAGHSHRVQLNYTDWYYDWPFGSVSGDGPINSEKQKPFYPIHSLIKFIIRIDIT